jgi:LCP family protein required for cell wall assembly
VSALHCTPRRHSVKARDYGVLAGVMAVVIGLTTFTGLVYYLGIRFVYETNVTVEDVTLLIPPEVVPNPPPIDEFGNQAVNILLMGSDTRAGGNAAIGGAEDSLNNDTTIIMHISADRERIELVSIPRDSLVRLPGCLYSDGSPRTWPETTKFNRAFFIGGMHGDIGDAAACVISTVQSLTDIPIQEFIVIDFMGVVNVINSLGGVPMCIPFDVKAPEAQLNLKAGPQVLSGWQAIGWARARKFVFESTEDRRAFEAYYNSFYNDTLGMNGADFGRIRRQQELLGKVFEVVLERDLFYHYPQLIDFLESVAESMTVSPNIGDFDFISGLAFSLRHIDPSNIVFREVPSRMHSDGINAVWVQPDADNLFQQIVNDEPISGKSVTDLSDAGTDPTPDPSATTGNGDEGDESDDIADKLLGACEVG